MSSSGGFTLKRPKRIGDDEDEDELMRFQEEFLKNKASREQPAAKVVRVAGGTSNPVQQADEKKPVPNRSNLQKLDLDRNYNTIFSNLFVF